MAEIATTATIRQKLLRYLAAVPRMRAVSNAMARREPARTSLAAADDRADRFDQPIRAFANYAWSSGSEHALLWLLLTTDEVLPVSGHFVLVRATLEGTAVCRWLTDPKEDESERLARVGQVALENARDKKNFLSAFAAKGEAAASDLTKTIEEFEHLRERLLSAGMRTDSPNMTKIFSEYVEPLGEGTNGEWFYRALSAPAHGRMWSMAMNRSGEQADLTEEMGYTKMEMNPIVAQILGMAANINLRLALEQLAAYRGEQIRWANYEPRQ